MLFVLIYLFHTLFIYKHSNRYNYQLITDNNQLITYSNWLNYFNKNLIYVNIPSKNMIIIRLLQENKFKG